ncbi:MAG: DUF2730 family protein [Desulfovibrio sp.]|uniref:DUF2730 family protein n=1 Tax=Desulfovibrio sp. TaxID=885 RepID=UPI001A6F12CF|nr:DUF2730 family protein [Desulfovibrio sp.]MBD5416971.1 DUF2730 family protein [Desulfovibrio sp.]
MEHVASLLWHYLPGIIQFVATGACLWLWWSIKKVFVTRQDCEACRKSANAGLEARIDAVERRQNARATTLQALSGKLDNLPTSAELQDIMVTVKELEGDVKGLRAQMDGFEHMISRLERTVDMFQEVHMK